MEKFYGKISINNLDCLRGKTIFITGGTGLIGINLLGFLNYINEKRDLNLKLISSYKNRVEDWMPKSASINYLKLDLTKDRIPSIKFDYLIHCATYAQPKKFLENPAEIVRLNTDVLFNLMDLSKQNKAKVLFISSAEVYGQADEKNIPTKENFLGYVNTLSERAIYAESKRLAETICYIYSKSIDVKITRVLISYGPGVKKTDMRVIPEFIRKAQTDKLITLADEGSASRIFCFVTDTIEMLLNIVINGKSLVYNVSGQNPITIRKLAETISKINNAEFVIPKISNSIVSAPKSSILDNGKYLKEFGKKQFVPLLEGLKATSEWFRSLSA